MSGNDYERATAYLIGRINYERAAAVTYGARQFKLERVQELLGQVGNPHQQIPIVHVAGTKGKGSTSAMIAAVLTAAGYRTGLFTSPHLERLEERIAIDAQPCSSEELVALVERLRPVVDRMDWEVAGDTDDCGPTYFELTTVMALLYFAERQAQAAVLEVGLGGRLDSTNVCQPAVSVITSISYDHMRQLGNTLAEIAFEKAGIVKPGIPLVSGVTADEPRQVIEQVCRDRGSLLVQLGRDFDFRYYPPHLVDHHAGYGRIDYLDRSTQSPALAGVPLGMLGRHQGANAAVAVATIAQLQAQEWQIDEAQIRAGLAAARSPARVEVMARRPTIVIDAAHNEASVEALLETLADSFAEQPRILIFATTQDKEVRAMMRLLLPRFDHVFLTRYRNNPRGVPVEELAEIAAECGATNWRTYAEPAEAWEAARAIATPDHLLCVTGSFFIAAEIGAEIRRNPLALARRE
ncbi:MAG TPA: folylpolyglutamate synthase/dihydrofolate synthase family protein [Pirellulales bacterium]